MKTLFLLIRCDYNTVRPPCTRMRSDWGKHILLYNNKLLSSLLRTLTFVWPVASPLDQPDNVNKYAYKNNSMILCTTSRLFGCARRCCQRPLAASVVTACTVRTQRGGSCVWSEERGPVWTLWRRTRACTDRRLPWNHSHSIDRPICTDRRLPWNHSHSIDSCTDRRLPWNHSHSIDRSICTDRRLPWNHSDSIDRPICTDRRLPWNHSHSIDRSTCTDRRVPWNHSHSIDRPICTDCGLHHGMTYRWLKIISYFADILQ